MQFEQYIAHIKRDSQNNWEIQTLQEHLRGVSEKASAFAQKINNQDWLKAAGLLHDIGKYSNAFQLYIRKKSGFDTGLKAPGHVDHATAGAQYAIKQFAQGFGKILAYILTGHHGGLLDWYFTEETRKDLQSRLIKKIPELHFETLFTDELQPEKPCSLPCGQKLDNEAFHVWIRMLFSCLVDADFLDTECIMKPEQYKARIKYPPLFELKKLFDTFMEKLKDKPVQSDLNLLRDSILTDCRLKALEKPGFFSLTVPTGGGKTLSSMAFALEHALKYNKERVIISIPYTSIIEQTADVYRKVFGDKLIIEHHCNIATDKETLENRLAAENWDAPVIVTTNVQLFESLFSAKVSQCRKLHNIINSVIIIDEVQKLPPEYLNPIRSVLQTLVNFFHVSVVFCTATQPVLTQKFGSGKDGFKPITGVREIAKDPRNLFSRLKRTELVIPEDQDTSVAWSSIAEELSTYKQVLCIVNTKKDCRELHGFMPEGTVHLSTYMCAEHRSEKITMIKTLLTEKLPVRVISTQLIEAGVDIDFPVVYRAMTGLDSIVQSAGRCNRNGILNLENKLGKVVVFIPPKPSPPGLLRKSEDAGKEIFRIAKEKACAFDPDSFTQYFNRFYSSINSFDKKKIFGLLCDEVRDLNIQFRTASKRFQLIDETGQRSIVVLYKGKKQGSRKLISDLKKYGTSQGLLRALQRFTVTVPEYLFHELKNKNLIEEIVGLWCQIFPESYNDTIGFLPEPEWLQDKFFK